MCFKSLKTHPQNHSVQNDLTSSSVDSVQEWSPEPPAWSETNAGDLLANSADERTNAGDLTPEAPPHRT